MKVIELVLKQLHTCFIAYFIFSILFFQLNDAKFDLDIIDLVIVNIVFDEFGVIFSLIEA
jgi:hypothetical protein